MFLPLYDRLLENIPLAQTRCLVVGGILLGLLLLIQLVRFAFRKKRKIMAVLSLSLLTGCVCVLCHFASLEQLLPNIQPFDGQKVEICAEVLEWDVTDYGSKYLIRTREGSAVPKGVKARLYSFLEPVADEGDIVQFCVPLETEIKNYDRSRGIFFYAFGGAEPIERVQERETIRGKIISKTEQLYQSPVLGVVQGVLFGEKQNLEEPIRQMMEGAGLVHILAVSGIHISLMALSCTKFLEVFRLPKRYIKILVLLPVWGYVALAQFSPSAVRAGHHGLHCITGVALQRDSDNLCALAAAAMGIVAVSPFALYSVSYQLSFVVTLGIILCTSPLSFMLQQTKIMSFLLGRSAKRMERFWMGVCSTLAASTAATVFAMPVMLWYFHYTAIWGIFGSLFALWSVSPLMILSMLSILFGMLEDISVFVLVSKVTAGLAGLFARWILLVSKGISLLPGALFYSHAVELFLCGIVVAVLFAMMAYRFDALSFLRKKQRMKSFLVCAVFCLCSVGAVLKLCSYHQLTIFRTDHAMILTRNNQAAVVGDICSSYEADEIETILRCEGISQLELMLCDSKDTDESQGIDLLLQKFPVKVAAIPSEGSFSAHIEKALGKQPIDPQNLQATLLGNVQIYSGENGVEIVAGEKKLLKQTGKYDIIKQDAQNRADVVMEQENWLLLSPEDKNLGIFKTLEEYPVVKIRVQ